MAGLNETLRVSLVMDSSKYQSGAKKAAKATDGISASAKKTKQPLSGLTGQLKGLAPALGAAAVVAGLKSVVDASVKLNESVNAVDKIFGAAGETIYAFGETSAEAVGLAQSEFQQMSVTTGALFTGLGLSQQEAADKTVELTQRAADMASVFNTDVTDALFAIQAGLRGETEPLRRFGVTLDAAGLSAEAVAQGLAATTAEVTKEQRALVAFDEVLKQTNASAGDFADTSDQLANQQRIFAAQVEDAKARVGQGLLPAMSAIMEVGIELVPVLEDVATEFANIVEAATPILKIPLWLVEARIALREFADEGAPDDSFWDQFQRGTADILSTTLVGSFNTFYDNIVGRFTDGGEEVIISAQEQAAEIAGLLGHLDDAERAHAAAGYEASQLAKEQEAAAAAAQHQDAEIRGLLGHLDDHNRATAEAAAKTEEWNRQLRENRQAILDAARAQRDASDPIFQLLDAQSGLTEAQAAYDEAMASGTATDAEKEQAMLDLIAATSDLTYAQDALEADLHGSTQAFIDQALAAGFTMEQIDLLLAAYDRIPPTVTTEIITEFKQSGGPTPAEIGYYFGSAGLPRAAAGGHFGAGEPVVVGEKGMEVFVPDVAGTIVPNNELRQGPQITIERVSTDDLAGDISEGLTMAAIAEQIDLIGDF